MEVSPMSLQQQVLTIAIVIAVTVFYQSHCILALPGGEENAAVYYVPGKGTSAGGIRNARHLLP